MGSIGEETYDAVIVGAGFAGIYQLYSLRNIGLRCLVVDAAGDVGGTWYWNLYPGAMSDTPSSVYRFSWDKEDLLNYPWKEGYVKQPEVLAYLNHVADKHDLRKHMRFNTEMSAANWSETDQRWHLSLNGGSEKVVARYVITALGLLSRTNFPDIPGIDTFKGDMHHTAKWPKDYDVSGKRVGVIGCGSTGVQVITELGSKVEHLDCYQRHPQYSVPSGDRKVTAKDREHLNENWDSLWSNVRNSITAFGFKESERSFHDATPEEREQIFQAAWDEGGGFRYMFATFNDIATDMDANVAAQDFIRRQIDRIVKDPAKAAKLKPYDVYARRPLCDGNASNGQKYFEQFNRENVEIVDLKETPIERIEEKGIRTADGQLHEHDLIVFATGFDAVEGNYTRLGIHGREGMSLKDYWEDLGPTSYLGSFVPNFPNFFLISGPKGPFTNMPPCIEVQVEFITDAIRDAEKAGTRYIEPTDEAEKEYSELCEQLAANSLFWKAEDNWIFGANVPGKRRCLRFYFGGMQNYLAKLEAVKQEGYAGFKPFTKTQGSSAKMEQRSLGTEVAA